MKEVDNKYGIPIKREEFNKYIGVLKNNIFKIMCLREENNNEWLKSLQTVIYEISGLYENFNHPSIFIKILNKLESLKTNEDMEFRDFRKTTLDILNSLEGEITHELF